METTETVIRTLHFNELAPAALRERVLDTMHRWILEVYGIVTKRDALARILSEVNPLVEFFKTAEGRRLFRIDDSDERLAKYLAQSFEKTARHNPDLMNRVIESMIARNENNPKLKMT